MKDAELAQRPVDCLTQTRTDVFEQRELGFGKTTGQMCTYMVSHAECGHTGSDSLDHASSIGSRDKVFLAQYQSWATLKKVSPVKSRSSKDEDSTSIP